MTVEYFRQWSYVMLSASALLLLASLTDTARSQGLFFLGTGLILQAISLAKTLARFIRRNDHDPRRRDGPWPGAEETL